MKVAYVRVSTVLQNEARQLEALEKYKCREINKSELALALKISRPTLNKLLKEKGL